MENMNNDLFDDTTLETTDARTAGACSGTTLCATAIGGTQTRCITNYNCALQDAFLDTGQ